jgi:signal-transduction protein with cAMP-binding, CBS, and nucleotidyltransferase domain
MEEKISDLPLMKLTAGEILEEKDEKAISVSPDTTIRAALQIMLEKGIGSILVMEGEEVKGIWTERDLMKDTLSQDFDPDTTKIGDRMTTDLHYASWNDSVLQLMDRFLGLRIRHLLIEKEGKFAGLLSAGTVVRAALTERSKQLKELNTMVSWEFYEDWKWSRKKKEKGQQ